MHSVSVAGVVRSDDGLLLCIRRRDNGAWQIPGGVLEQGETFYRHSSVRFARRRGSWSNRCASPGSI
ncbi:NUDIX domain-containing protein [Frankia sp. Cpl3]|nr:NUDIX domain-containing protein [Frankia sp. Cpl3]